MAEAAAREAPNRFRVAFHAGAAFHRAFLEPLHARLHDEFDCLLTSDFREVLAHEPRILVVSDATGAWLRQSLPDDTLVVFTRHGFSSKHHAARSFAAADFACVSSPWVMEDCFARGWRPRLGYWVSGFIPMDPLLDGSWRPPALPADFPDRGPTLLFAPTHNPELGALPVLGSGWVEALRTRIPDLRILAKPHPVLPESDPESMELLLRLGRDPRVHVVEDPHADVYPYLPLADVLVTDVSSVAFYYLALDRPIVLVDNPGRFGAPSFDPEGPEWTWRNVGARVEGPEDLVEAVARAVEKPEQGREQRERYRARVFGDLTDGRAADRVADEIRGLLDPRAWDRRSGALAWKDIDASRRLHAEILRLEGRIARLEEHHWDLKARVNSLKRRLRPWWRKLRSRLRRR